MRLLLIIGVVALACAAPDSTNQPIISPPEKFRQVARDRFRRELSSVIAVARPSARRDSAWVALVKNDSRDTNATVRFNRAAPHYLTWALRNTSFDQSALLASLPTQAQASTVLLDSLLADSAFTNAVMVPVGFLRGTAWTNGRREFLFNDLVTFATRFFHLEADSAKRVVFSLHAKAEQLRDVPIRRSLDVDAWVYSFVRPAIEMDSLPASRAIIRSVTQSAPAVRTRATLDSLERVLWNRLEAEPEFRSRIKAQLDRTAKLRMFSYRIAADKPWADALITTYSGIGVTRVPDSIRARFDLDTTWYGKYVDAGGIPVTARANVPDEALLVARDIVNHMLSRADIRANMIRERARVGIMANSDSLMDMPEQRDWKKPPKSDKRLTPLERARYDQPGGIASMTAPEYWNRRARGMGGTFVTCSEENLLGYPGTQYFGWNLLVHEFAHNIHGTLRRLDRKLLKEIDAAYSEAMAKKMYVYASGQRSDGANTVDEYFAEGSQFWFWDNSSREFVADGVTQTVWSPKDLERYDPKLYAILSRIYADHHIPADVFYNKKWR